LALYTSQFLDARMSETRRCGHTTADLMIYLRLSICGCPPWAEEGKAYLAKAAEQGHAHAIGALGAFHKEHGERELAVSWFTKAAEAGVPQIMYTLGNYLEKVEGVRTPDYPAAAHWYRRAADADYAGAAMALSNMYTLGRGRA
jgi:TPR repeat protein